MPARAGATVRQRSIEVPGKIAITRSSAKLRGLATSSPRSSQPAWRFQADARDALGCHGVPQARHAAGHRPRAARLPLLVPGLGGQADHPHEVVETALAHVVGNRTAAASARSDLFGRPAAAHGRVGALSRRNPLSMLNDLQRSPSLTAAGRVGETGEQFSRRPALHDPLADFAPSGPDRSRPPVRLQRDQCRYQVASRQRARRPPGLCPAGNTAATAEAPRAASDAVIPVARKVDRHAAR